MDVMLRLTRLPIRMQQFLFLWFATVPPRGMFLPLLLLLTPTDDWMLPFVHMHLTWSPPEKEGAEEEKMRMN